MSVWNLTAAQLRMYLRDRQSVFFGLFFPLFFMLALGSVADDEVDPVDIGIVNASSSSSASTSTSAATANAPAASTRSLVTALNEHELIDVSEESEREARLALEEGELDLVLLLSATAIEERRADEPIRLSVLVDAAQPQRTQQALTLLNVVLTQIERDVRQTTPLFRLEVEDVRARNVRYVDFLIPGLLAFMVLQLSIAGSGFNVVEWKRKGILTRLFVTPLRPAEFIASLIAARLAVIVVQISLMLVVADLVFDVSILGGFARLYFFVIAGSILFLSLGFALGGIAKTQSAVMALGNLVIFPQVFLAGVFFPIDTLPVWLQPVASVLPLNFLSDALRQVANEGAVIADLDADLLGLGLWTVIGVFLAVRFFRWSDAAHAPKPAA